MQSLGSKITVQVTAKRTGVLSTTWTLDPGGATLGYLTFPGNGAPIIVGQPKVDEALIVFAGQDWGSMPAGTESVYQWFRDGVPMTGATGAQYIPTVYDVNKNITVAVTRRGASYVSKTVVSGFVAKDRCGDGMRGMFAIGDVLLVASYSRRLYAVIAEPS